MAEDRKKINIGADNFETIFDKIESNIESLSTKIDQVGYINYIESFVAYEGQTDFLLLKGKYTTKADVLKVTIDGILQRNGKGYRETSSTTFSTNEPLKAGQKVYAEYHEVLEKPGTVYTIHGYTLDNVHVSPEEPKNINQLWVNNADENVEVLLRTGLLEEIREDMKKFGDKVDTVHYAISKELDPGYFKGLLPGSNPDIVPELPEGAPELGDGAEGTIGRLRVKRGLKEDLEDLQQGEFGFCIDTEELYIGNGGGLRLLAKVGGVSRGSGSGNLTGEYVELISSDGTKYRLSVNNAGKPIIVNSLVDTIPLPPPEDSGRFDGLLINKVYGGGNSDMNTTPSSHSFIELYNGTANTINLRGLSLQYAAYMNPWEVLPLRGEIKPFTSFLVRCAEHADPYRLSTRLKITNFDMGWDVAISDKGFKVYLCVGTEASEFTNPANTDGMGTKEIGYINLFAVGGEDRTNVIDGYEEGYMHFVNKNRMLKRRFSTNLKYPFANTGNNAEDIEFMDLRFTDLETYAPRHTGFGQWYIDYNQTPLDKMSPNMINVGLGYDGDTTRTFTWQSQNTEKGFLKYKKKGDVDWITVTTDKKFAAHWDTDVIIHSAIIRNLIPGIYIYKAGEEGYWSDEYELEIIDSKDTNRTIKMLHISDQQGWDREEYLAWEKANAYIEENEEYDFILNTGDISQNANRAFEWRDYYDLAKNNLRTHAHMACVGNNDLIDKKDSEAFTYYFTCENSPHPSVYSFNYGFIHFICLNSNIIEGYAGTEEQIAFIREDMANPENQKRWTIVYMHESPYTIVKSARLTPFIDVFAEVGIDLVLCGHHHCYSRSNPMGKRDENGNDVIDPINGVYYVMSQATGFKTGGKQRIDPDNRAWVALHSMEGVPCYMMWDITWDNIKLRPYRLMNILPLIDNVNTEVEALPFDEGFTITKN